MAKSPESARSRWLVQGSSASGAWAVLAALFVPKCPLCIAFMLTIVGMNAALASAIAPLIRPLAFGLPVAIVLSLMAMHYVTRVRSSAPSRVATQVLPRSCCK